MVSPPFKEELFNLFFRRFSVGEDGILARSHDETDLCEDIAGLHTVYRRHTYASKGAGLAGYEPMFHLRALGAVGNEGTEFVFCADDIHYAFSLSILKTTFFHFL